MKTIQSIDRAIYVVDYISQNQNCRLVDLCNQFQLNKSTLHGILSTLECHGIISKDSTNATYNLGVKLFELGKAYEENFAIKRIAKPYLVQLSQKFSETVHLAVLNENRVLYIDKVESPHSFRMTSRVGTTDPILTTAIGKAILAGLSMDQLNTTVEVLIDSSLKDKTKILDELSRIDKEGFALDLEELEPGLNCVAVPIKNKSGEVAAAISICIPTSRLNNEILEDMKTELMKICKEISNTL